MASTNTPSSGGGSSHRKRLSAGAPTIMPTKRSKVATIRKSNQTTDTGTADAEDAAMQPGLVTAKPPKMPAGRVRGGHEGRRIGKRILDAEIQLGLIVRGSGTADAQEQRLQSMIKTIHAIQAIPCPLQFGNRQDRDSNFHPDPASELSKVQAYNPPPLAETSNKSLADPIEFTRNPSSAAVTKSHFDSQPKVDQSPLIRNPDSEISYAWWQQRAIWKWVQTQYHKDAQFAHIKDFICQCGIPQEDPDRAVVSFWLYWTERKRTTTSMAKFGEWMRLANEICSSDSKIPMSAAKRLAATHLGGCQEDWNLEEVLHRWIDQMSWAPDKSQ